MYWASPQTGLWQKDWTTKETAQDVFWILEKLSVFSWLPLLLTSRFSLQPTIHPAFSFQGKFMRCPHPYLFRSVQEGFVGCFFPCFNKVPSLPDFLFWGDCRTPHPLILSVYPAQIPSYKPICLSLICLCAVFKNIFVPGCHNCNMLKRRGGRKTFI